MKARLFSFIALLVLGVTASMSAESAWFAAASAPPANDQFADAFPITSLPFSTSGSTDGATLEAGEPQLCAPLGATVWYTFTPSEDIGLIADTFGSTFNTVLAAYSGDSPNTLTTLACNDQFNGNQSQIQFLAAAGTPIHIQVGGYNGASGELALHVRSFVPPANDQFADAFTITSLPFSAGGSNDGATLEADEPQPCSQSTSTIWYTFTPSEDMSLKVDVQGFTNVVSAYTGDSLNALTPIACGITKVFLRAAAGTPIHIQVGGYYGTSGAFALHVASYAPPANDQFADPFPITSLPFSADRSMDGATSEPGEPPLCGPGPFLGATLWYTFTPSEDMRLKVDTQGSNFLPGVAAYTGNALNALTTVACNGSEISFAVAAGTPVHLQVGSFTFAPGEDLLHIDLSAAESPTSTPTATATGTATTMPAVVVRTATPTATPAATLTGVPSATAVGVTATQTPVSGVLAAEATPRGPMRVLPSTGDGSAASGRFEETIEGTIAGALALILVGGLAMRRQRRTCRTGREAHGLAGRR